jgi:hypothetical protein
MPAKSRESPREYRIFAGSCVIAIDWSVGAGVAVGVGTGLGDAVGVDVDAGVGVPL